MNISTPQSPKKPSPLKILLLGLPGSRKTTLMLQFPHIHVIDCDQNLDGPTKYISEHLNKNLTYSYDSIRTDDQGNTLLIEECFDRVCDKLSQVRTQPEHKQTTTVGLDSLSHVNEFIIRKIMKAKGITSMEMRNWSDFATQAYTLIVAKLDQTGKTVICTCHEERVTEPDDKNMMKKNLVEINPLFSGRVGDSLGAYFTDVWRLEKRSIPGGIGLFLQSDRIASVKCTHLKNSVGLPAEIDITKGFGVIEPYLKGRL